MATEQTKQQVIAKTGYEPGKQPLTHAKVRLMRKDPTLSLVRKLFFAGIIVAPWQYETAEGFDNSEKDNALEFIKQQFEPMRRHILNRAALGCFDFGWAPFEKVLDINNGFIVLKKLKPLIQDDTEILEDEDTGAFLGFKQSDIELPIENCMLFNWDVEGTDYKGESTLANAEEPYDDTKILSRAAKRYDKKMAGAHWVVYYPNTQVDFNGELTPSYRVAEQLLKSLESSGSIAVPNIGDLTSELEGAQGWKIELISAQGGQFPFKERMSYLDVLKVRACGFPERSVLEGNFGTKAEAETHTDFVITLIEDRHMSIIEQLNWHCVNHLLRLNFGTEFENKIFIKPAPLNDNQKAFLRTLYDKILSNNDGFIREVESIDISAVAESIGVPRNESDTTSVLDLLPQPTDKQPPADPTKQEPPAPIIPTTTGVPTTATDPASAALNGAQISALIGLCDKVRLGEMQVDVAIQVARISFPTIKIQDIQATFRGIVVDKPATPATPAGTAATQTGSIG